MDPRELLNWLKSLIVWTPEGSQARQRIQELINRLKQHLGQT
jgi:hypothetical protein